MGVLISMDTTTKRAYRTPISEAENGQEILERIIAAAIHDHEASWPGETVTDVEILRSGETSLCVSALITRRNKLTRRRAKLQ